MAQSKPWQFLILICAMLQIYIVACNEVDRITCLPGQPMVNFQQYAGYVTIDEQQEREYFYYFVEAETEPAVKPLVLWLNGGPGCSSIGAGAFSEHGPFQPKGKDLVRNEYSWNKVANMLYLESPAGVGFSYSANKSFYNSTTDEMTASDNLIFLQKWVEKFPDYKNRDFFVAGESYGGHFVPQLANLILQSKPMINFKGIAIGNPLLEFNTDMNSQAEFLWSHGLISDAAFDNFTHACNFSEIRRQMYTKNYTNICLAVYAQVMGEMSRSIDPYDVTQDVCLPAVAMQSRLLYQREEKLGVNVCVEEETGVYLNREDVKNALHARLVGVDKWIMCSNIIKYNQQNLEIPTIGILGSLVKAGIRVIVYSGDQDSVLPLTGTRTLVHGLAKDLKLNTTLSYSPWFHGRQVSGWTQAYGDLLSFATIKGASHEAPLTQPERSLVLFASFIEAKPLPGPPAKAKGLSLPVRFI